MDRFLWILLWVCTIGTIIATVGYLGALMTGAAQ